MKYKTEDISTKLIIKYFELRKYEHNILIDIFSMFDFHPKCQITKWFIIAEIGDKFPYINGTYLKRVF